MLSSVLSTVLSLTELAAYEDSATDDAPALVLAPRLLPWVLLPTPLETDMASKSVAVGYGCASRDG